jgi:hypothetical protein
VYVTMARPIRYPLDSPRQKSAMFLRFGPRTAPNVSYIAPARSTELIDSVAPGAHCIRAFSAAPKTLMSTEGGSHGPQSRNRPRGLRKC